MISVLIVIYSITKVKSIILLLQNSIVFLNIVLLVLCGLMVTVVLLWKSRYEYRKIAYKDTLTGVYSRAFLDWWLSNYKLDPKLGLSTVVIMDIDNFKDINDTHGHLVGDQVLIKIAEVLRDSIRKNDFIIRYGGDEFLLILAGCNEATSLNIVNRAIDTFKDDHEFEFDIEVSYGIAQITNKENFIDVLNSADEKMYSHKNHKTKTSVPLQWNI